MRLGQSTSEVLYSQGDTGDQVAQLQQALVSLGYDVGPIDGIYGPQTTSAVLDFQHNNELIVTGDTDTDTWALLMGSSAQATTQLYQQEIPAPEIPPGQPAVPATEQPAADILRPAQPVASTPAVTLPPPAAAPPSSVRTTGTLSQIQDIANQVGAKLGVDPLLILSVINAESSFRVTIRNWISGAVGLMQLTPIAIQDLAQRFGVRVTNPADPQQNILGGSTLFKYLLDQFGQDVAKAVAAYHSGASKVQSWIAKKGAAWLSLAGSQTRAYVQKVTSTYQAALSGGGAGVMLASYQEPGGTLAALLPDFSPELGTIQQSLEDWSSGGAETAEGAVAAPGGLPAPVIALGVVAVLATIALWPAPAGQTRTA